jgi:two-component system sensor histidine kinase UhpB
MQEVMRTEKGPSWGLLSVVRRVGAFTALKAGLVGVGCYLGSALEAVYPELATAILFPPYAILTAALFFAPVRHWWIYLLASALGNFLPHRQGAPASWVLLTEAANFTRALVAAGGMRLLVPEGPRLDTLRSVATFIVFAVIVGPFVAAFVGAGVVVLHGATADFWPIGEAWFLSNALTGLTLLPILLIAASGAVSFTRRLSWRRGLEAASVLIGLLAVGTLVFAAPYAGPSSLPARLYAPLPFLLWAAVRFGPGGTSASLLVLTLLAIWGSLHGHGPFITQSPDDNLLSLQLFLLVISVPLMVLAALTAERHQENADRKQRETALQASYDQNKELTGRLIAAQETERARIARQLHDEVNQQLAAFSIALSSLKRRLPNVAKDVQAEITRLQQQAIILSDEIRNLSHELHPGVLQHAGLVAALRGSCAEMGLQHGIEVSVEADDNLGSLPAEVALCLYRVAQEALHNTAIHARARQARVALRRTLSGLELTVSDDGCGFDLAEAKRAGGLGLLSIDERVRLVRGSLRIDSLPEWGTQVCVQLPLESEATQDRDRWDVAQGDGSRQDSPLPSLTSSS